MCEYAHALVFVGANVVLNYISRALLFVNFFFHCFTEFQFPVCLWELWLLFFYSFHSHLLFPGWSFRISFRASTEICFCCCEQKIAEITKRSKSYSIDVIIFFNFSSAFPTSNPEILWFMSPLIDSTQLLPPSPLAKDYTNI